MKIGGTLRCRIVEKVRFVDELLRRSMNYFIVVRFAYHLAGITGHFRKPAKRGDIHSLFGSWRVIQIEVFGYSEFSLNFEFGFFASGGSEAGG